MGCFSKLFWWTLVIFGVIALIFVFPVVVIGWVIIFGAIAAALGGAGGA